MVVRSICTRFCAIMVWWAGVYCMPVHADLSVPAWYDEGAAVADWHYRVPVTIPAAAAVGSTIQLDADFIGLLDDLGVNTAGVTFDSASPRIVRPGGSLASLQEFTDEIYNGALDNALDGEGQIRFILEDAPLAGDYFLYFDITANGVKPANPAAVINGHFEHSSGSTPTGWTTSATAAGGAQNNEVHTTTAGQTLFLPGICSENAATVDVSPNSGVGGVTGRRWHLLGYRDACEDGSGGSERIRLRRDVDVPAGGAAGELEFYFQVQAFDGIVSSTNYDWIQFRVNGSNVNHNALSIDNTPLPQLDIDNNRLGRAGYGSNLSDFGWKRARLSLSAYAGTTIEFEVRTRHSASDNGYRTWVKVDDVVWSLQTGVLGAAEAFGVNITSPADTAISAASEYGFGQTLMLQAVTDADTASVTAVVLDPTSNVVAAGVVLFDDGTHGDLIAGDRVWTNDGSDAGAPTYDIPAAGPPGTGWMVRVYALDSSDAQGAVTNGLLRRPGGSSSPENQANFYNVDEQLFTVSGAIVDVEKSMETIEDGISPTDHKSIPGAWLRYAVRVENQGPDPLDNDSVIIIDELPGEVAVCVINSCTCVDTGCTPVDPVQFDDSGSPIASGLNFSYAADVEYSQDGVDFSYTPVPDAQGFDASIRFIRVTPTGAMSQPAGSDNAEFDIRYVVRID